MVTKLLQRTSVSELASRVAEEIRLPHYVHLLTEIEGGLYAQVVPDEIRQVLYNLLLNAAQFSPAASDILLRVRSSEKWIEIAVVDKGFGIPEENKLNVFRPFYTTRTEGGTGVGLWVSREMVMRSGGTLAFESHPELRPGTTFTLSLPLIP